MREGMLWLDQHLWDAHRAPLSVDYDEMLRQMQLCEEKYNDGDICGCDTCRTLKRCRKMFDSRCPKTPVQWEVLEDRPWCCGHPMRKDGHQYQGNNVCRKYRCRYCGRAPIDKVQKM